MFSRSGTLMTRVEVTNPDLRFAQDMPEQSGGARGELLELLQSVHVEDAAEASSHLDDGKPQDVAGAISSRAGRRVSSA